MCINWLELHFVKSHFRPMNGSYGMVSSKTVLLILLMLLWRAASANQTEDLPVITCLKDIRIDCDPGQTYASVIYTRPKASKGNQPLAVTLLSGYESGSRFPLGTTMMLFEAKDDAGNKAVCSFKIIVGCPGNEFTMHCPETVKMDNEASKCGATVSYNAPYSVGNSTQVLITQPDGLRSGSFFPVGITKNTFTGTLNGVSKSCSFNIVVRDAEPPVISCPPDISVTLPDNEKGAAIKYIEPVVSDNCGIANLKLMEGLKSTAYFPVGVTKQVFQVSDSYGNKAVCSFNVEVKSKVSAPVIPVTLDEKLNVGNDSVIAGQTPVKVKSCNVTLCIYDDAQQDGDSVSIIFNNEILVDRKLIKVVKKNSLKNAFIIPVELKPEGENFLISKAWNVGSTPPNTLKIDIYEGSLTDEKKLRELKPIVSKKISSRPGMAGAILLTCNQ